MVAISFGSSNDKSSRGTPSTNIKGFCPFIVLAPRNLNWKSSSPGCPLFCIIDKPGNLPVKEPTRFAEGLCLIWSLDIAATAPVTLTFFCVE